MHPTLSFTSCQALEACSLALRVFLL